MIEPTIKTDLYELYLADCLDILPQLTQLDAVITDPVWPNFLPEISAGFDPYQLLHDALTMIDAKRLVLVMRYDSDPRFLSSVPKNWPFFRVQILEFSVPGYNGRKLGGLELAYCFGEPVKYGDHRHVIPGRGPKVTHILKNGHPCPRSVEHFHWLVNWWSDEGEIVLDPFMGSGTTGIACMELGRYFIGIEIRKDYFEIAEERIRKAAMQLRLEI